MTRRTTRVAAAAAGVLLLAGCGGFRGAYSLDLPGGADLGEEPYQVTVQFLDVLDLVPQSGVRVADVPVGRVDEIELNEDWTAEVTLSVNGDVELPENAVAMIQQSSLLGEKYVELAAPGIEQPRGRLGDGDLIPLERTNRNVEVEELLGALSLVLNGGGLTQLTTITREVGEALEGREDAIRDTLDQLDVLIGGLDEQKTEINRALDSANALAATLAERTGTIETALDTIGPGLDVINEQRGLLVSMLESLSRLGDVGTRIIDQAAAHTVEDLRLLQPILTQLAAAGPDLAGSLDLLLTYPFPASAVVGDGSGGDVPLNYRPDQRTGGYGLFANMTATLDLDLTQVLCRYVVDPLTGALETLSPEQLLGTACGQPGTPPGNQNQGVATGGTGGTGGTAPAQAPLSILPGEIVGQLPTAEALGGLLGFPLFTGGQP
ncbi:MCE family protein [Blastococcus sp. TML/M2B]|uniref:MCE family protein n=1 Tax=unclassified Blastococcus TaxID=2619396 RepID=UPI00190A2DC1|nr:MULTISPECIES: MCE family protein [unclassified Blastococcus]MBN1093996.1 MCE family protein [Blastococcus sp. TML/M2B]MBN1095888.1 MCE family protein [Blastococcus sp. TML/C7B]